MSPHVLIVMEGLPYPSDVRVRAEAAALVNAGYKVTVAGPTGRSAEALEERIGEVRVTRFRAPPPGRGPLGYLREYGVAMVRLARLVRRIDRRTPVDLLFVCNPPDALVALRWLLWRSQPRVLLDYREISPELLDAKYGSSLGPARAVLRRGLLWSERLAFRAADVVLTVSEPCREIAETRGGVPRERVFLVGNGPDARRVYGVAPRPELRGDHDHLVLWLGAMSRQEGLERLIHAADELVNRRGRRDVGFALVGPGDVHDDLRREIDRCGLGDVVRVRGEVGDDLVRAYVSTADVCVNVDACNAMNDRAAMRKVLEYMAAGRPVVQFPLAEMRRLCGDATRYAADANSRDLARVINELLDDDDERARLGESARERVAPLLWQNQVASLLDGVHAALTGAEVPPRVLPRTFPAPRKPNLEAGRIHA
jgi:glycosyltransferase involved in cell wall biosynthesis